MMKIEARHITTLLLKLSEKTKVSLEYSGFELMADKIGTPITQKYLYEGMHLKAKQCEDGGEFISVQNNKVDAIARYLGFDHMQHFLDVIEHPLDNVLLGMKGNYYSYLRRNDDLGVILRSPVRIFENDNRIYLELKGPSWTYKGQLRISNGTLFVLMESGSGKEIHHVYKIGKREKPFVLQGIFSAVSTASEPIGGRVVLIRTEEPVEKLTTKELPIKILKSSEDETEIVLAGYFSNYSDNNLNIKKVATFTIDDLR